MWRRLPSARRPTGLPALLALALIAGCTPAMRPEPPASPATQASWPNEWPLRFKRHAFEAICYNTIGCTVLYNHRYQVEDAPDAIAPPPRGADYRKAWSGFELGIANFPPPAVVRWRSLDRELHEAEVDIGAIFADEKIIHHVSREEIPEGWAHELGVEIYLEVNDRTINVYMFSDVATKAEQVPGNKYSHQRQELTLAWTRTF